MSRPKEPLFVAREQYRRRRIADAARLLPVLGLVLLMLPVLWAGRGSTGGGLIYLFAIWALLIAVIAQLSRRLAADGSETAAGVEGGAGAAANTREEA